MSKPVLQDPLIAQRNPFEVYMLVVGAFSGLSTALTGVANSKSLEIGLDPTTLKIWALCLGIGCVAALFGVVLPHRARLVEFGLQLERFGLLLCGTGLAVFCYVVLTSAGWNQGGQIVIFNGAFVAACVTRVIQITLRFQYANTWRRPERGRPSDGGK